MADGKTGQFRAITPTEHEIQRGSLESLRGLFRHMPRDKQLNLRADDGIPTKRLFCTKTKTLYCYTAPTINCTARRYANQALA